MVLDWKCLKLSTLNMPFALLFNAFGLVYGRCQLIRLLPRICDYFELENQWPFERSLHIRVWA